MIRVPEGRPSYHAPSSGHTARASTKRFKSKSSRDDRRSLRSQNCLAERGRDPSRFAKPRELSVSPSALRAYSERHCFSGRVRLQNFSQPSLPFRSSERLGENDTQRVSGQHPVAPKIFQFDRSCNLGWRRSPRLFGCLTNNTLPPFPALPSRTG